MKILCFDINDFSFVNREFPRVATVLSDFLLVPVYIKSTNDLDRRFSLQGSTMRNAANLTELTRSQQLALTGAIGLALALATYGVVGSYTTISAKAAELGVPLPHLVPIGIDGGLIGVVVLDLVLAWTGHPVGWLRQLARLLTIGTVAANVSAGWPNPTAIGLHAAAPLMLLVMVEAGRAVLLRRAGLASGVARDRIPIGRWILSPWRTWLLWRRMILWQITSYRTALDLDARVHRARRQLTNQFGSRWKQAAPANVVWMLRTAPYAEEACAEVEALTCFTKSASDKPSTSEAEQHPHTGQTRLNTSTSEDQLQQAMRINKQHWAARNRPVSADTLREQLHIGTARARELTAAVRAMDKEAVENKPTTRPSPALSASR